jgi:hypothetical protein
MMRINGYLMKEPEISEKNMNTFAVIVILIFIKEILIIGYVMVVMTCNIITLNFVILELNNIVFFVYKKREKNCVAIAIFVKKLIILLFL